MKDKVLIGIVIILVLVIGFEGYYLFTHDYKKVEPENSYTNMPNEIEDYVKLVDTRKEDNEIIQEYEVYMNNKTSRLLINYSLFEYISFGLSGMFQSEGVYFFSVDNDTNIANGKEYVEKSKLLTTEFVDEAFNENNFIFIKGIDDKNYLGIISKHSSVMSQDRSFLYIYNEYLEYLYSFSIFNNDTIITFNDGINRFYSDEFNSCSEEECQIRLKIDDNKIYVLYDICSYERENIIEERVYTINNNRLEYEVINTYDEEDFAVEGQSCKR